MKNIFASCTLIVCVIFCHAQNNPPKNAPANPQLVLHQKIDTLISLLKKTDPQKADSIKKTIAVKPVIIPVSDSASTYHVASNNQSFFKFRCSGNRIIYPDEYIRVKTDSAGLRLAALKLDTFRLWIDGICYTKIKPLFLSRKDTSLIFRLSYDTSSASPWQLFYAYPNYWTFTHEVTIRLGTLKTEFKSPGKPGSDIKLATTVFWMVLIAYGLFVILIFVILRYGKGMIKDVGIYTQHGVRITNKKTEPSNAANGVLNISDLPSSLARCQFLFWLLIIFLSILHIWGITDTLTTPTGTVLLLLGISGGTFYIGRLLDTTPSRNPAPPAPVAVPAINAANEVPVQTPAQKCVKEFLENDSKSKGLLLDILTDGNSISLHRLQLVIFTIFLGIYFLWQVVYGLALPEFSTTMLLLMGISSGTYASLKTLE